MAATRGREFVGSIFLMIYIYYRTLVQSFMLSSKTARFWCLAAPQYGPTITFIIDDIIIIVVNKN